jgi:peroxiredoxin/tetratricopeptide (TPR) repeat protein
VRYPSLAVFALATTFLASAADPRLRIEPAQPHPGQTLTVTFDPKGGPLEKSASLTLIFGWNAFQSNRMPMQRKGDRFTADVRTGQGLAYMWCWVEDQSTGEKDTNRGTVWDTYFYDDHGMPMKEARMRRAELYQNHDQPVDKTTASLNLLEEELRAFPANSWARAEWWGLRFEDAGRTIEARDQIVHEIAAYVDANPDKAWAYQAAIEGYQRIGRTAETQQVMRAFVKRFPDDDSLDGELLGYFKNYNDVADLEGLPQFSKRWEAEPYYWEALFSADRMSNAAPEKLQRAGERWLASLDKSDANNARIRIEIAEAWLAKGMDPVASERIAREAVNLAETDPVFVKNSTPVVYLTAQTVLVRVYRSTLGWALFEQHRYEDALHELERAVALGEKEQIRMDSVYYRLGQTLEQLNRPGDATEAYIKEFALGRGGNLAWNAAAAIYSKQHGGFDGFEAMIRSRANDLVVGASPQQPFEEMNEKIGRFELRGADGQQIPLSRYEGKVVILEFWATWCGPCLASLENTQKLAREFAGKIVVLAISIDSEETRASAQPFLRERGYDFTLLVDDEHQRDLRFYSIPARFLVDRNGRVRVRQSGANPYADILFEQRLQTLLNDPRP